MATIKGTSNALGNLINKINAGSGTSAPASSGFGGAPIDIDDSIPTNMLSPEPVFKINYKSTEKQCVKKAKEQLMKIVKEVVPTILQNSTMILDKVEQDAEQLGHMYYESIRTDKVIQANMDALGRGEISPRLFEVYAKLSKQQSDLAQQITIVQNNMRKNYIDTYLDLQQKDNAEENLAIGTSKSNNEIPALEESREEPGKLENVIMGTGNVAKMLQEKKKQALIAKFQEVKDDEK
jgi:hypothetical protein